MQAPRTQRNRRASDQLENLLHRSYFGVAGVAALGMLLLPLLPVPREARLVLWLMLTGASFLGALVLLLYWDHADLERDARLLNRPWAGGRRRGLQVGLSVRDRLTGLYSPEYWLHALERRNGRYLPRATPITCLMIGVEGLPVERPAHGGPTADEQLRRIALQILSDVRPSDLVCHCQGGRFAVALLRCPVGRAETIAARLIENLRRLLSPQSDNEQRRGLGVQWEAATLPGDALTPAQLLRVAAKALDRKLLLAPEARVRSA